MSAKDWLRGSSDDRDDSENAGLRTPDSRIAIPEVSPTGSWLDFFRNWCALLVPIAGCSLAGGMRPWAIGTVILLIAVNLLLVSPRLAIPGGITILLVSLSLWLLCGLLPLAWAFESDWRTTLQRDFDIFSGRLVSPQPWVTFENWVLLSVALAWLWHCLGRGFGESERRMPMLILALMTAALAALSIWYQRAGIHLFAWQGDVTGQYFGPFRNRNHFGTLLTMGAIVTCALTLDSCRRRHLWWPIYLLLLVPIIWALLRNTSRAGLGLMLGGLVAWMALATTSRRSWRHLGMALAVLFIFSAAVILFGEQILQRLQLRNGLESIVEDSRFQIWSDCMKMAAASPLFGVGAGCFRVVFPFFQSNFIRLGWYLHPESDWFWLLSEAGIPAVLLLLLILFKYVKSAGILRSSSDSRNRKDRSLRNACAVAALSLPVHSLVDTPAHQPGIFCTAALLAGLSLRERKTSTAPAPPRYFSRLVLSLFCGAAAFAFLKMESGAILLPGSFGAKALQERAQDMVVRGDLAGAAIALDRAIEMAPLQWDGYFDRASLALEKRLPPQAALEDFARVRFLEPKCASMSAAELSLWLKHRPEYALPAIRELMRRDSPNAESYYEQAMNSLRQFPSLTTALRSQATTLKLKLIHLRYTSKEEFPSALKEVIDTHPDLGGLSSDERFKLFRSWHEKGDRSELLAMLEKNAAWKADGWIFLADDKAARGDYRGACQLALEFLPTPTEGSSSRRDSIAQLQRDFLFNPTDWVIGFSLYESEKSKGLLDEALTTLDKIAQIPNAPRRVLYEQGLILNRKGDHAAAWHKLKAYSGR